MWNKITYTPESYLFACAQENLPMGYFCGTREGIEGVFSSHCPWVVCILAGFVIQD